MRALAAAGRQSDALAVYEELRGRLADELGVDPSADVREAHLAVLRGSSDGRELVPGRLPARLTSFAGREEELKLVAEFLDTSRLVTVVGPGGVGKTSLAVAAANQHRTHRSGRLWLVPLAGVQNGRCAPTATSTTWSDSRSRWPREAEPELSPMWTTVPARRGRD